MADANLDKVCFVIVKVHEYDALYRALVQYDCYASGVKFALREQPCSRIGPTPDASSPIS